MVLGCENKTNVNFRNTPLLCISGYKFNGCTGQPLAGWQIEVFNSSTGNSMGTATTNATGYWQVCNLVPGSYRVTETIKTGWTNSNPSQNVVLGCENKTNVNFRNTPLLCISGYKFNGCNGQPLAGWQIEVFNSSTGDSMGTATTNATGYWQVCNLVPGSYRVTETIKPGWTNSNPSQNVVLGCENKTNVNFRNTPLLCISGYKFNGCNGQPLAGWQIEVFNSSTGASMGTATTNATGYWQVCNLVPGSYRVTETIKTRLDEQQPQPECGSWMRKQDQRELPEYAALVHKRLQVQWLQWPASGRLADRGIQ